MLDRLDRRIEEAFGALQIAHTEAHKREATAAFIGSVAMARRLLSEVIEDHDNWIVIGGRRCGRAWLANLLHEAAYGRALKAAMECEHQHAKTMTGKRQDEWVSVYALLHRMKSLADHTADLYLFPPYGTGQATHGDTEASHG